MSLLSVTCNQQAIWLTFCRAADADHLIVNTSQRAHSPSGCSSSLGWASALRAEPGGPESAGGSFSLSRKEGEGPVSAASKHRQQPKGPAAVGGASLGAAAAAHPGAAALHPGRGHCAQTCLDRLPGTGTLVLSGPEWDSFIPLYSRLFKEDTPFSFWLCSPLD